MRHQRIAMITGVFPAVSETFVVNHIVALQEAGHQVDVFCFKKNKFLTKGSVYNNISIKELSWSSYMPSNVFLRFFKIISILIQVIPKELFLIFYKALFKNKILDTHSFFKTYFQYYFEVINYDLVHVQFGDNAVRLLPQLKVFKNDIIVTFHGYDAHNFEQEFYKGLQIIKHIQYTVNTKYTKQKLLNLGFNSSQIHVIPVGLDVNKFQPKRQLDPNTFNLLFIGRLVPFKAPLLAIKIVEEVAKTISNVFLTIIGEGPEYDCCVDYIEKKQIGSFVKIVGGKTQREIIEEMNKTNLFLFPGIIDDSGRCENQGLVIQEAQAMKIPVLLSDVGGIPEGVLHEVTGFVLPSEDKKAFVDTIIALTHKPKQMDVMGQAGRTFVMENYDISKVINRFLELLS